MHTAVVLAHPNPDSYAHELARRAVQGLSSAGHDVTLLDLAAIGFRAAMSPDERAAYHTDKPIQDPMIEEHARLITAVDAVVFVYPTWWAGLPALLKGWLDRVLVPGVGFRFDDKSGKVRPGLTNVRHIVGITTYGSPRWYVKLVNDCGRRSLLRTLRLSCGLKTTTSWLALYAIDTEDDTGRTEFASKVEREMAGLR